MINRPLRMVGALNFWASGFLGGAVINAINQGDAELASVCAGLMLVNLFYGVWLWGLSDRRKEQTAGDIE